MISFTFPDTFILIFSFCAFPLSIWEFSFFLQRPFYSFCSHLHRKKMQARSDMSTMINILSVSSNLMSVVKQLITKSEKQSGVIFFLHAMVLVIPIKDAYWQDALVALLGATLQWEFMFCSLSTGTPKAFYKVQEKKEELPISLFVTCFFFNMCVNAHVHTLVQVHSITVRQCKPLFLLNFNIN